MRKAALVTGLVAAAAAFTWANAATVAYKSNLAGTAEVPPVQSAGKGAEAVNVDTATKQASWRVEYTGLSGPATAAHIHCGAAAGARGAAQSVNGAAGPPAIATTTAPRQMASAAADTRPIRRMARRRRPDGSVNTGFECTAGV